VLFSPPEVVFALFLTFGGLLSFFLVYVVVLAHMLPMFVMLLVPPLRSLPKPMSRLFCTTTRVVIVTRAMDKHGGILGKKLEDEVFWALYYRYLCSVV
jgi:hypothetical protein